MPVSHSACYLYFFFNDSATTEIYTLSLHDALPICRQRRTAARCCSARASGGPAGHGAPRRARPASRSCGPRSEEHTSELQSHSDLVCRLLLEKKKKKDIDSTSAGNGANSSRLEQRR